MSVPPFDSSLAPPDASFVAPPPMLPATPSIQAGPLICGVNDRQLASEFVLHHVQPGDTIWRIAQAYYGEPNQEMNTRIEQIQRDNPELRNPDRIHPGQIILLRVKRPHPHIAPAPLHELPTVKNEWAARSPKERDAMVSLAPVFTSIGLGSSAGGAALSTIENTIKTNVGPLREIPNAYMKYRNGEMTKGQYDYFRRKRLDTFRRNVGPMERLLFGKKTPHEALRMSKRGGIEAVRPMNQQMGRLARISKYASRGGTVLAVVGVGASAYQISQTKDHTKQNEILIETAASAGTGLAIGVVAGFFLVSNPVGWGVALAIGVGSAAASYGAGKGAAKLYNEYGDEYDVIDAVGLDHVFR